MKTQYAVTREGKVIVESDDLEYIKRVKLEMTYRQTGRTTKMLFRALGDPAAEVVIVSWNRYQVRHLMDTVGQILKSLDYEYYSNTTEGIITNFGKTYRFVTQDYLEEKNCKINKNTPKYLDEK